jgi:hypothetical protein
MGQSLGIEQQRAELGAGAAARPATAACFPVSDIDGIAQRALIIVMIHVPVTLTNGVPGWNLRHQAAFEEE